MAPLDPVRNMADPPAGQWFPQMALELVTNANPPLNQSNVFRQ
jgi:endoglucanase